MNDPKRTDEFPEAETVRESKAKSMPGEAAEDVCSYCGPRHKERSEEDKKTLLTRLRRVEGQIRGIEKMVEGGAYCPDILIQVSAATSALNSFNKELLACHIRCCVAEDIRAGKDETIDELCRVLQKLMK